MDLCGDSSSIALTRVQTHVEMSISSVFFLALTEWYKHQRHYNTCIRATRSKEMGKFKTMQINISAGQNKIPSVNPIREKGNVSIWSSFPCIASHSCCVFGALLCVESASNAPFLFMTNTLKRNYLDMARLISAECVRALRAFKESDTLNQSRI